MTDKHLDKPERRSFMKGLAAAGGAVALGGLTEAKDAAGEEASGETRGATAEARGYRLTPHINDYYRTLNN